MLMPLKIANYAESVLYIIYCHTIWNILKWVTPLLGHQYTPFQESLRPAQSISSYNTQKRGYYVMW